MQKNAKKTVNAPEPLNIDELAIIPDDELKALTNDLNASRDKAIKSGLNPRLWDEELCYVQREHMIRVVRAREHAKYMLNVDHERRTFMSNEELLPEADIDNTQLVKLIDARDAMASKFTRTNQRDNCGRTLTKENN